jgi:glutamine cyclotransferase
MPPEVKFSDYSGRNPDPMKADYPKFFITSSIIMILVWTISCSGRPGKNTGKDGIANIPETEIERPLIKIISPDENTIFKLNDPVKVKLSLTDRNRIPDSVIVSFDSKRVTVIKSEPWEYTIPSGFTVTTGRKSLKITTYAGKKRPNTMTRFMIFYSDVVPEKFSYKVIHVYPHDPSAFIQGLFYDKGILYEGTGQEMGSCLREVELETGKVLRQHNLDNSLFGEGITLYKDKIYQVTWQNKIGFVYDKLTFNLINKIYYATQGWGLTTINDKIVMSDGTNTLYFYEPDMFTIVSRLEVYDDRNKVDSLNELEFIDGEIWANIWMTDRIARIDPVSGKVKAYIDLSGLLKESDKTPETDVLNGIAFDREHNRIFVTGKRWPKLFEIKVSR